MSRARTRTFWPMVFVLSCAAQESALQQGQRLAAARQYDQAIAAFLRALEENPDSSQAHLALGMVYTETGRLSEATKVIEQARRIDDSDAAMVALATVYFKDKRYTDAAGLMEKVLARSPDAGIHHLRLGIIRRHAGDLERALESFRLAITLDPNLLEARSQLGLSLKELRRYDEALEVLKDAVKEVRASEHGASVAELQTALADVYEAMQLYDYALHSYKLAVRNDAKSGAAVAGVGRVLCSQGRFEEAIELLSEGTRRLPSDGRVHLQLGLAYRDFRLDGPAVGALKKAVELQPADKTAYAPLLELMDRAKTPAAEVVGLLAKAAQAMPDDQGIALRYGKTAHELKRYDEAQKALRRVLDMEPSHVEAGFLLGMTLLQQGNVQAARESADVLKYLDAAKADELAQAIAKAEGKSEDKPPAKLKPRAKRKPKKKRR